MISNSAKETAARRAVAFIEDGMTVGLGTGSTAAFAILELARRIEDESIHVRCVPTSLATESMARNHNIPLLPWESVSALDLTVDGADEVDPEFRMIKGGGGALLREKIVAFSTRFEIIVVDETKIVPALGQFPLPVVVCPFGLESTQRHLSKKFGKPVSRRNNADGSPFTSDDGLAVLDIAFGGPLPDIGTLEQDLKSVAGVLEVGLFVDMCHRLVIGDARGGVSIRELGRL